MRVGNGDIELLGASTSPAVASRPRATSSAGDARKPRRSRKRTLTTVDRRTRVWIRIADLTAMLTAALGSVELTPMRRMKIEQAAQLTALAELARGRFMRDGEGTLDDIVRLERKADSAVRALGIVESKPKPASLADYIAARTAAKAATEPAGADDRRGRC